MRKKISLIACALAFTILAGGCSTKSACADKSNSAYIFTSFHDADQKFLRFLYSYDGYHWTNAPGTFLEANVSTNKQFRDPSILRAPDGTFHLVWTAGWHGDQGFGYASSRDLIHWSEQKFVPVMTNEPTTVNVWAPELFYDDNEKQFKVNAVQSEASPLQLSINNNREGNFQYVNAIASPLSIVKSKLEGYLG